MSRVETVADGRFFGGVLRAAEANGLTFAETASQPGCEVPRHGHDSPFLCVALDGSFVEEYESDAYELGVGSLFYHPGAGVHAERFGRAGGRCFVVQLGGAWLAEARGTGVELPPDFRPCVKDRAARLALDAHKDFRVGDAAALLSAEERVLVLLAELTRTRHPREARCPAWLSRATERVHDDFLGEITLATLAAEVAVHPSHLARTFARRHGCTIGETVRRLRLEHSRTLMASSRAPLSEIALAAGFTDQSHFCRLFKRRYGVTPGGYRREQRAASKNCSRRRTGSVVY
jgi:AraC family transcriptional regulator